MVKDRKLVLRDMVRDRNGTLVRIKDVDIKPAAKSLLSIFVRKLYSRDSRLKNFFAVHAQAKFCSNGVRLVGDLSIVLWHNASVVPFV